jgi:cobalamin biosynthesis protein CobC
MRDHGGNLDAAVARHGAGDWIDLSTGINRIPYPVPTLDPTAWRNLPTRSALENLGIAAACAYETRAAILPMAGAQAAIQLVPRSRKPGLARVLSPTYNEHAASLLASGWRVETASTLRALAGADLAVVVNPNNPDGATHLPETLLALLRDVGCLVVDESFADPAPHLSLGPHAGMRRLLILRSFGKFYGLAGLRLGFVLGHPDDLAPLAEMAGPWPISGPAIAIGQRALQDANWQAEASARLAHDVTRLDAMTPWPLVGGTALFRLYKTPDAPLAQEKLAQNRIWSRIFSYSGSWLRLGLPGSEAEWRRVATAMASM